MCTSALFIRLALGLCCLLLCGCPRGTEPSQQQAATGSAVGQQQPGTAQAGIVVSIEPLRLVVQLVASEDLPVWTLLPPGADAHNYEPRPSDLQQLSDSSVLLWTSEALDVWADGLGDRLSVQVIELLPDEFRRPAGEPESAERGPGHDHGHGHDHGGGAADPHFWSDPLAVAALLPQLAEVLAGVNPGSTVAYKARVKSAVEDLQELHEWAKDELAHAKGKAVLQMHPSLDYLLARYGIRSVGAVEVAPGREPSPRHVAELVAAAKEGGAVVVITEPQLSDKAARTIAREASIPVVELDPEAGAGDGYAGYADWFRRQVEQLAGALQQ